MVLSSESNVLSHLPCIIISTAASKFTIRIFRADWSPSRPGVRTAHPAQPPSPGSPSVGGLACLPALRAARGARALWGPFPSSAGCSRCSAPLNRVWRGGDCHFQDELTRRPPCLLQLVSSPTLVETDAFVGPVLWSRRRRGIDGRFWPVVLEELHPASHHTSELGIRPSPSRLPK